MRPHPLDTVARVQLGRMVEAGAGVSRPGVLSADFSGDCMRPIGRAITYRKRGPGRTQSIFVDIEVRCRRCEPCRRAAQREWMARAIVEAKLAGRTWFGTLTLSPATRMRHLNTVRHTYAKHGADFDAVDPAERWRHAAGMISRDVTLWQKRVREAAGSFRYMFVVERHKDGTPHMHGLVHENPLGVHIGRRTLEGQWSRNGFSQWRLQEGDAVKAAAYATKYITKTMDARVRASIGYGDAEVAITAYRRAAVRSATPTTSVLLDEVQKQNDDTQPEKDDYLTAGTAVDWAVAKVSYE